MKFTMDAWPGLKDGSITVTFRRWKRRQVIVGNQYRSPSGMLEVLSIAELADVSAIEEKDVDRSGAASLAELRDRLGPPTDGTTLFRIEFRNVGSDPRDELREQIPVGDDLADLLVKMSRLDARSNFGPWTHATLAAIRDQPAVRAPDLAEQFGRETKPFKLDVRKLKAQGLTESLKVGYQLSPRGRALLASLDESEA